MPAAVTARTLAGEPELGPQRPCARCDDHYPLDAEFWHRKPDGRLVCRACQREHSRRSWERRRDRDPDAMRAAWREAKRRARAAGRGR